MLGTARPASSTPSADTRRLPPGVVLPQAGRGGAYLSAVGDITSCGSTSGSDIAALLRSIPGAIATLGDTVYPTGSPEEFARCFAPVWRGLKRRTHPSVGNHEYLTPGAAGYFGYFGAAAGDPSRGYYSYDLGSWHVVVLNDECYDFALASGCGPGSPEEQWLRADLAAHPTLCTLAYWHEPLFSSGRWHSQRSVAFWRDLYRAGADVVLNGHEHFYERFAPQSPDGAADPARGIREFVVGTGGGGTTRLLARAPNSRIRLAGTRGVLTLALARTSYSWRYNSTGSRGLLDSGEGRCH